MAQNNQIPVPRSPTSIINDMIDVFLAKQGITNLRIGSSLLSIFEAVGQSQARNSYDTFTALNSIDLSQQTGISLDNIGNSENIPRYTLSAATGSVDIGDSSFTKISTSLAPNQSAPIVGSTIINVVDASLFPGTGNLYIGRGTPNYEGPIHYTSKANIGANWQITLSSATTKFHNTSEFVILAQGGNRQIPSGTIVQTQQASISSAVSYSTLYSQILADGENLLENILVVAQSPGTIGNCIAGAISSFQNAPFTGATVTNPLPISNGIDTELDDDYRERIEIIRASRSLGTVLAVESRSVGVTDGVNRVTSASFVRRFNKVSNLYIDDGTGYEMTTAGVPLESIIDSASGGEPSFETVQRPIAQAFVISQNTAPFNLRTTDQLVVMVGGITYTHSFAESDFYSINNASAYEVVASINSNPNIGFLARTANGGANVILFANSDVNDDIQVLNVNDPTVTDANDGMAFPLTLHTTLQLYKNDRLLYKDGRIAKLNSEPFVNWAPVTGTQSLGIIVDGTSTITYGITDQDFINNNTGYVTVNKNSLQAWVKVLNNKIAGITAYVDNGTIAIISNLGATARSSIEIIGGSLISANMFKLGKSVGVANDYNLDRNNGQIYLTKALAPNDKLSLGSDSTRSFIESENIGTVTLTGDANLWFAVDSKATIVETGINSSIPFSIAPISIHPFGHTLRLTASSGAPFQNVEAGHYIILWDPALDTSLQGAFRVVASTGTTIDIERKEMNGLRTGHRAVALAPSGSSISKVLITGGSAANELIVGGAKTLVTNSCEIYDPNTKVSTPVKPMNIPRAYHTATLLSNGKVLVSGGISNNNVGTNTLEIYDPGTDSWTLSGANIINGVYHHQATLLQDGTVFISGGTDDGLSSLNIFFVYDPGSDSMTHTGTMVNARFKHRQVLLPNGNVFLVGGITSSPSPTNTTEIWSKTLFTSTAAAPMTRPRDSFGLALIGTSPTTLIAMGANVGFSGNASYEIYTIGAGTWGAETTIPNNLVYENKNLVTLPNGHVVGLYGYSSAAHTTALGFTYDGATFTSIAANTLWTDSSAKWNVQLTSIANGTATIKNKIVVTGGTYDASASFGYAPTANIEEYDEVGNIWLTPDPATNNSILLSSDGLSLAKTDEYVFKSTVPAGANYTPSSIVNALNSSLIGASATTYLTNRLRVNTNSFDTNGDIALLTQNTNSAALQLEDTDHIDNLFENIGFVESASFLGTPSFKDAKVIAATEIDNPIVSVVADSGYSLVGLKNWMGGMDNSTTYHPTPYTYPRFGNNYKFYSEIASATGFSTVTDLITRKNPSAGWLPGDRVYLAAPYAIGPRDTLNLIVDNDITKQFAINMFRKLKPTTNTYGITNAYKDISGGNVSLATTFGLNFNFNDFAVYMPARGIAFNGDNSREMLFRYYRPGNDGINTQVAFGNPMGPNQDLYTYTSQVGSNIQVTVRLASGALKSITADSSTRIGQLSLGPNYSAQLKEIFNLAISNATRTADVTTLTLTLPTPATDHGLNVGDLIWVNSTSPTYSSGIKPISARTATTISYSEINGDNAGTANIGDVSFSSLGECTFQGSGAIIGDWFRFNDPLLSQYSNATFYISAVDGAGRNLTVLSGDQIDGLSFPVNTTIQWAPISQSTNIQIFANANQTASQIITAINAAAALENSTCPITATSLGTGFGVINQCTIDAIHNVNAFYSLLDGMNYVSVTAAPGSPAGDYQLTFKNPINGTLSANADWQNEIVYICPTTAQNVVDWLNAPTVTGLSTVCNIQTSNKGQSVQINTLTAGSRGGVEVQGGFANSATATVIGPAVNLPNDISYTTISNADSTGLTYGTWCRIQNTINAPFFPFTAGMQVTSWTPDGQITFNSNLVTRTVNRTQAKLQFEKQGNFIAISDMGLSGAINFSSVTSSCWVRITTPTSPTLPPVALGNQGIYRILRLNVAPNGSSGVLFIENPNAIEEQSEAVLEVFTPTSIMPGQNFVLLTSIFGAGNLGTWKIKHVGTTTATSNDDFANLNSFVVDTSSQSVVPQSVTVALSSTNQNLVYIVENTPSVFIRKALQIVPNPGDGSNIDVRWDDATVDGAPTVGAASGSIITALNKLDFPLNYFNGVDAYNYATGLVGAVNTVLYGDPQDPITYPGIAATNANIGVSSSIIKRIKISVSVRLKTNTIPKDMKNRIKSAIATVINTNPAGNPIAFSEIISAIERVVGVKSAVITSPVYNLSSDLIPVQASEKTKVLNLDQDIQVSFIGS